MGGLSTAFQHAVSQLRNGSKVRKVSNFGKLIDRYGEKIGKTAQAHPRIAVGLAAAKAGTVGYGAYKFARRKNQKVRRVK